MRSKFFDVRAGDQDVSIGPEQFVKVFLGFLEKAIGRARTPSRMELVARVMDNIDPDKVEDFCTAMIEANQLVQEREKLLQVIGAICSDKRRDKQIRSYKLGFVILNDMGEAFLERLFWSPRPEFLIKAPTGDGPQGAAAPPGVLKSLFPTKPEYFWHFAYGPSMFTSSFTRRLKWSDKDVKNVWGSDDAKPRKAILARHRLIFGKRATAEGREGRPTIVPDPDGVVEGVVYRLPAPVRNFLDTEYAGYEPIVVSLNVDGKTIEAQAFVSKSVPEEGLMPSVALLSDIVAGAEEYGLSEGYVARLRATRTLDTTVDAPPAPTEPVSPGAEATSQITPAPAGGG
jgi:hypothetical protein